MEVTRTEQPQLSRVLKTMEMRGLIVAVPDPDELLADIMELDAWREGIEKRSTMTRKKRKAW